MTPRAASVEPHPYRSFEHAGWQDAAAGYGSSFAFATVGFANALLESAGAAADMNLLDVACGPGLIAAAALGRGCVVVGVDFSTAMLAIAREHVPDAEFLHGDAEALPLPDATFDVVVSNFGLHHFPYPARALAEARRVLHPSGRFAATVWAPPEQNIAWKIVFDAVARHGDPKIPLPTPPHGRLNRAEDLTRVLVQAGWPAAGVTCCRVHGGWRMRQPTDLIDGLLAGTVRMAALIEAQKPVAQEKIRTAVAAAIGQFRHGDIYVVPTTAVLVSARATPLPGPD